MNFHCPVTILVRSDITSYMYVRLRVCIYTYKSELLCLSIVLLEFKVYIGPLFLNCVKFLYNFQYFYL